MFTKKQELLKIIESIPDDKVIQVFTDIETPIYNRENQSQQIMKIIIETSSHTEKVNIDSSSKIENNQSKALESYQKLQSYVGIIPKDFDCEKELEQAKEEKYGHFN